MNNPRVLKSRGETGRILTARPIINLKYEACKKGIEPLPTVLETDALPIELLAGITTQT